MSLPPPLNPYQSSITYLTNAQNLLFEPRRLPASAGITWISDAWYIFKGNPWLWIGMFVAYFLIAIVFSLIPILNLLINFLGIFSTAGVAYVAHRQLHNQSIEFSQFFIGFRKNTGQLLLILMLCIIGVVIAFIPIFLYFSWKMLEFIGWEILGLFVRIPNVASADFFSTINISTGLIMLVVMTLFFIITLIMAIWFAPILVILHNMLAFDAMKLSFIACLNNIIAFFVYGVGIMLLGVLAILPLGLGLFILFPILFISYYTAYRLIFTQQSLSLS